MVGTVTIGAKDGNAVTEAKRRIEMILDPPTADVGAVYAGRVVNLTKFGAFVNILPGRDGLLHISKLSALAGRQAGERRSRTCSRSASPSRSASTTSTPRARSRSRSPARSRRSPSAGAGRDDRRRPRRTGPLATPARRRESSAARESSSSAREYAGATKTASFEESFEAQLASRAGRPRPGQPAALRRRRLAAPEEQPPPQVAAAVPAATEAVLERLDNGCRLVTERVVGARSASLGVFVTVGSRHEPAAVAGASHFLEHLLFKGTDRLDAATIAEALDRVGGQSNAYTARELTCFWVRLLGEDLDVGLSILGDIVTDPALRASDVDAERTVIEDEILGSHDDPASVASERFFELIFPSHPLGRDPLGTLESVRGITTHDVPRVLLAPLRRGEPRRRRGGRRRPRPRWRAPSASWRSVGTTEAATVDARAATPRSRREVLRAPFEQAQVVVGVPIPPRAHPQRDAYRVYDQLLGGGLSSRLFTSIRERAGLAYQVYSERAQFTDAGALCVAVGTAPEHAERVLELVASRGRRPRRGRDDRTARWTSPARRCAPTRCSRRRTPAT